MSATARSPFAMTVWKAHHILEHPVFGDPRSIEARDLLLLAERVERVRRAFGDPSELMPFARMTKEELESELVVWKSAGWKEPEA